MTREEKDKELQRIVLILGSSGARLLALPPDDRTQSNKVGRLLIALSNKLNELGGP